MKKLFQRFVHTWLISDKAHVSLYTIFSGLDKNSAVFAATSVSITTDAATMHTGDSYVTVTAHWLDAKWKMMSCVLGVAISNGEITRSIMFT